MSRFQSRFQPRVQSRVQSRIALPITPGEGGGAPAKLAINDRLVLFGDSIVSTGYAEAGSDIAYIAGGFTTWAQAAGGSRLYIPRGGNLGIAGNTTAQMLARVADVTALSPKAVLMDGGTNDLSSRTAVAIEADLAAIFAALLAGGVRYVVITTILPRFGGSALSGADETKRLAVNAWLLTQATARIKVVNCEGLGLVSGDFTDGLHPNSSGAFKVGLPCGVVLAAITNTAAVLDTAVNSNSPNATMAGTGGSKNTATGTVANNLVLASNQAGGATVVGAKSTLLGNTSQLITLSGTYTSATGLLTQLYNEIATVGLSAGDVIEGICEIEAQSMTNIAAIYMSIIVFTSGYATLAQCETSYGADQLGYPASAGPLVLRTPPALIAAGTPAWIDVFWKIEGKTGVTAGAIAAAVNIGRNIVRKVPAGA